jgi:hypothetical protein
LEGVLRRRNPSVIAHLRPGLEVQEIIQMLNQSGVKGPVEVLMELYSWRNGTIMDEETTLKAASLFPMDMYYFLDLQTAISQFACFREAAARLEGLMWEPDANPKVFNAAREAFPLFSDGATSFIALDLASSFRNRILIIEFESTTPVCEAYRSFEELVVDAIRVNTEKSQLACF